MRPQLFAGEYGDVRLASRPRLDCFNEAPAIRWGIPVTGTTVQRSHWASFNEAPAIRWGIPHPGSPSKTSAIVGFNEAPAIRWGIPAGTAKTAEGTARFNEAPAIRWGIRAALVIKPEMI